MAEFSEQADGAQIDRTQRIAYLISSFIRGTITPREHDELDEWVGESDANMKLFEELTDEKKLKAALDLMSEVDTHRAMSKIKSQLNFTPPQETVRFFTKSWHYMAAASLIIAVCIVAFFIYRKNSGTPELAKTVSPLPQDLQPGSNEKAILILGDGSTIVLDQAKDGRLASQGGSDIIKQNGQIAYKGTGASEMPVGTMYNTVTTPRGGSYPLTLSDGTKVWLNAASSIRFPARFQGNERRVVISGEVYFEVVKNKTMPFRVEVKDRGMLVEVLGTHFNINSYSDELVMNTTLLEGSVKIVANKNVSFLKPGQQAEVNGGVIKTSETDVDMVMAWKNGLFRFRNADIATIMKQVSRWYDVDIEFDGKVNTRYSCLLSRNIPASKLFEVLEETGGVHFKIDGKKVRVLP